MRVEDRFETRVEKERSSIGRLYAAPPCLFGSVVRRHTKPRSKRACMKRGNGGSRCPCHAPEARRTRAH